MSSSNAPLDLTKYVNLFSYGLLSQTDIYVDQYYNIDENGKYVPADGYNLTINTSKYGAVNKEYSERISGTKDDSLTSINNANTDLSKLTTDIENITLENITYSYDAAAIDYTFIPGYKYTLNSDEYKSNNFTFDAKGDSTAQFFIILEPNRPNGPNDYTYFLDIVMTLINGAQARNIFIYSKQNITLYNSEQNKTSIFYGNIICAGITTVTYYENPTDPATNPDATKPPYDSSFFVTINGNIFLITENEKRFTDFLTDTIINAQHGEISTSSASIQNQQLFAIPSINLLQLPNGGSITLENFTLYQNFNVNGSLKFNI